MIRLRDIYSVPSTRVALVDNELRKAWFPELHDLDFFNCDDTLVAMESEGRLKLHQLTHQQQKQKLGTLRYLTFDEAPMMIVFNEGWERDDRKERWVTDVEVYRKALAYLMTKQLVPECQEYSDPDVLRFEEEVLYYVGEKVAADYGHPFEPRTKGYMVMHNDVETFPPAPRSAYLLFVSRSAPEPTEYLRRGAFIMKQERLVPRDELDEANSRIGVVNDAEGRDRVYLYHAYDGPLPVTKIMSI